MIFTAGTFLLLSEGLMYIFNKMSHDAIHVSKKVADTAISATNNGFTI